MSSVPRALESSRSWEIDLRARLIAGDETGLNELYDQYASFVFGLARRVAGSEPAAEDVTQDVFVSVWERPEAFDPERGSMRSFIGTLAHRRAVDWVRREESRRRRAEAAGREPSLPPDVEEAATALIMAERVRVAVDALPDDQRVAVQLAYFGGRTYRQVAEDLGLAEGTAKARLRVGLRRLARELETEGIREWA